MMRKFSNSYQFLFGLAFALLLFACKTKSAKDFQIDPAFKEYINSFTSGVVSIASPIVIHLNQLPIIDVEENKEITENLFKISPAVKGKTIWTDAYTVQFIPEENLEPGKDYWIDFDLQKVADVPQELKTFQFPITTIQQAVNFEIDGLKCYTNENPALYQLKGVAFTSDIIPEEVLTNNFSITINGKKLPKRLKWEKENNENKYLLIIDSLERKTMNEEIKIEWNKKPGQKNEKSSQSITIPAIDEFNIIRAKVIQHPEQFVLIQFSDPLNGKQNLDGLIEIMGEDNLSISVATNEVKVYLNQQITGDRNLVVNGSVLNYDGKELFNNKIFSLTFEAIKPAVRLVGKGNILPSSNQMVIPFEAVNLKAVDVRIIKIFENNITQFFQNNSYDGDRNLKRVGRVIRKKTINLRDNNPIDLSKWNRFNLDISKYIEVEQGAIYRVEIGFRKYQSVFPCSENETENLEMDEKDWDEGDYADNDSWKYSDDWGYDYESSWFDGYNYSKKDNPCSYSYYRDRGIVRNIFASDIGIIAKKGTNNEELIVITNLITAQPISNAKVTFYDYQQQIISTEKTDKNGIVKIKTQNVTPFFIVAQANNQKGYLRLGSGNSLSMSHFDIDGTTTEAGIKGYIYGERGVWRPGDTLFLSFMLEDKEKIIPKNHPVIFELFNSQGQLVERKVKTKSINGLYNFTTPTAADAPTGNWLAQIEVGGATFSKSIKVETIKPNRLKINLQFKDEIIHSENPYVEGSLTVNWLHGAPARELNTDIFVEFVPTKTVFKGFENYIFDDYTKSYYSYPESFIEKDLDNEGKLSFKEKLELDDDAPGMLKAIFTTRAFEKGGDFSIDQKAILYAPYSHFVGIKSPKNQQFDAFETDTSYRFPVISVDKNGKIARNRKLNVEIFRVDWNWWWESNDNGHGNYISRNSKDLVHHETIYTNSKGEGNFDFSVDKYDWGPYLIQVTDSESGHSTSVSTYFDWPSWMSRAGRENPAGATMLSFSTDKKEYSTGEKATITFPSSEKSRALISIESGTKVLDIFWPESQGTETRFELPITPDLAPNCYIHITLLQPHQQTLNDAPIRLYGVVPIMVKNQNSILEPIIKMPDELAPNSTFTIEVKEKNNRDMTYTIAVVDEGLLDLTRFKTPNPWNHFYAREALGVKTWDLFDYVIGAYGAKVENLLTIGGDENIEPGDESPIRFKPMVRFIGPFSLSGGKIAKHQINVPNYIGSVRTMLIAGQDGAYGNTEKTTPVKKPLMLLSTLPRVLRPNEKVQLPVNIFVMDKKVKNVQLQVKTNNLFKVNGSVSQTIHFNETGDKVAFFELETTNRTGVAKVEIIGTSGHEKYSETIELEISNPNLAVSTFKDEAIESNEKWESDIQLHGVENSNQLKLELSTIPPINLEKRLSYLTQYPHGCLEQITSIAFPQLYLSAFINIDEKLQEKIDHNISSVIDKIQKRQLYDGGFAFWQGDRSASDWGTTYSGHFLLEAEKKGYALPYGLKEKWINYQTERAKNWKSFSSQRYINDDLAQAYRLYTLALAGKPALGAMNKLRSEKTLSNQAAWRLAATYQIIGKNEVAKEIIQHQSTAIRPYTELGFTFGNQHRDQAMIIETLTLMGEKTKALPLIRELSEALSQDHWMSTQTTAYALLSIALFTESNGTQNDIDATYTYQGKTATVNSKKAIELIELPIAKLQNNAAIVIENKGKGVLFARIVATGIPPVGSEPEFQRNIKMEVAYLDLNEKVISIDNIEQGTDFYADVTISNPGMRGDYKGLALSQIFPSGWEIRNQRMDMTYDGNDNDDINYQDIRDDRVYSYFDLYRNQSKTIRVQLHASYLGEFIFPATFIEAMYDNSIAASIKGKRVKVVAQ